MNWQQILALGLVLAVAVFFIWRSADPRKHHKHSCKCGCEPGAEEESPGKNI
jgi:hypothetical protein